MAAPTRRGSSPYEVAMAQAYLVSGTAEPSSQSSRICDTARGSCNSVLPTKSLEHSTAVIERNLDHDPIIGDGGQSCFNNFAHNTNESLTPGGRRRVAHSTALTIPSRVWRDLVETTRPSAERQHPAGRGSHGASQRDRYRVATGCVCAFLSLGFSSYPPPLISSPLCTSS